MPEDERQRAAPHVTGGGNLARTEAGTAPSPPEEGGLSSAGWIELLTTGAVEVEGRLPWSSNYSFLVTVSGGGKRARGVYKPGRGERQLWDFGSGLFRREVAAYELSAAVGLDLVPETVLRCDAPYEEGSLQRFVEADFEQHYFSLVSEPVHDLRLRELAGLDLLLNNADRKGGHVLLGLDGSIWGIDNGLCFHTEPKLRTVMWDFAGDRVPESVLGAAAVVAEGVPESLDGLISRAEAEALRRRARALLRQPKFPSPRADHRSYPWPLV